MRVYKIIYLAYLVCGFSLAEAQINDKIRPNIIWIVSEDNSPFFGAYGDSFATTPNIDKLSTQGVLYTNAFCRCTRVRPLPLLPHYWHVPALAGYGEYA